MDQTRSQPGGMTDAFMSALRKQLCEWSSGPHPWIGVGPLPAASAKPCTDGDQNASGRKAISACNSADILPAVGDGSMFSCRKISATASATTHTCFDSGCADRACFACRDAIGSSMAKPTRVAMATPPNPPRGVLRSRASGSLTPPWPTPPPIINAGAASCVLSPLNASASDRASGAPALPAVQLSADRAFCC